MVYNGTARYIAVTDKSCTNTQGSARRVCYVDFMIHSSPLPPFEVPKHADAFLDEVKITTKRFTGTLEASETMYPQKCLRIFLTEC